MLHPIFLFCTKHRGWFFQEVHCCYNTLHKSQLCAPNMKHWLLPQDGIIKQFMLTIVKRECVCSPSSITHAMAQIACRLEWLRDQRRLTPYHRCDEQKLSKTARERQRERERKITSKLERHGHNLGICWGQVLLKGFLNVSREQRQQNLTESGAT